MHELEPQAKGRRTLLATFERHAHDNPTRTFAAVARSGNIQDGFDDVSFAQVSRAVDCLAYDIEREFGRSKTFETILFFDSGFDLRYALAFFAFQKCGFKVSDCCGLFCSLLCAKIMFEGPAPRRQQLS